VNTSRYAFIVLLLSLAALTASAQITDTYVVSASANSPGAFGTRWATQFSVMNPQTYALKVNVTFLPTGGGQGLTKTFNVPANAVAFSDNILDDLFGITGTGALTVATFAEDNPGVKDDTFSRSFLLTTDTYNTDSLGGTYGQTIPGAFATYLVNFADDGISGLAHGIRNDDAHGWRANVGAVNLGRSNVSLLVSVYDIDGNTILNKQPMNIPGLGHAQARLPVFVDRGTVEFFVTDPSHDALVFPYVSVIDAYSGDPKYQAATLFAKPSSLFKGAPTTNAIANRKLSNDRARAARDAAKNLGIGALSIHAAR